MGIVKAAVSHVEAEATSFMTKKRSFRKIVETKAQTFQASVLKIIKKRVQK